MSGWQVLPLSEIAVPSGASARSGTFLPVYSVTKHRGFVPSLEYFRKQVFSRELGGYTVVERGQFAYATIHLDEGSIGICPERCLISPMYTVFRITGESVHPPYVLRYLKSPRALAEYPRLGKGSVERRRSISFDRLGQIPIPLPPLREQRRIAQILDRVEALRAKRRAVLAKLDTLTQAIFVDMFGDPTSNPKGWPICRFSEVLAVPLRNGLSPSSAGNVIARVLTLSAITGDQFNAEASKESTFASPPPDEVSVSDEDFLICRGNGNLRLVGKGYFPTARVPDMTFPDTMIAARIAPGRIERPFLQHIWNSASVRQQIESVARTTNGTFKVNQSMLESVQFVAPPQVAQRHFSDRIAAVNEIRERVRSASIHLDALFASLQHRAFRGELTS